MFNVQGHFELILTNDNVEKQRFKIWDGLDAFSGVSGRTLKAN